MGIQRCIGDQEFKTWGSCSGEVTPQAETLGDGVDNDCDGEIDETTPQPPPTCSNGATNYPTCTVNAGGQCLNGNTNPPACSTAPTCNNGATNYPTCTVNAGGQCLNGNTNPPACSTAPTCGNGATNYPTCTVNAGGQCLNGNTNPPACSTAPTCSNGATNYPTCTVNAGGQCLNGNMNPPACTTPPSCGNGATNYPTCTVNAGGQCLNGNTNPPACSTAPTCSNGATNYPTCTVNAGGQCLNGNTNPPACSTAPTCNNGATNYPTCTVNAGGQCLNGNTNPPACSTAPTCSNGATNYPTCTVNAGGQCLNGNTNPPACSTAPTCGNGATNYPTCTVNAAGQCLNGRINPPVCTTAPVFALDITSPNRGYLSANSVLVADPQLSSSPVGVTTNFTVTIKNTGNTTCTPSSSQVWSQYVGTNAGVMDCAFDFQGSAHLQPLPPGQSQVLGVRAFAKNSFGANYTFNASNSALMGGLRLRCAEDASQAIVFSVGLVNAVAMSPGSCGNGAVNPPTCTVNAAGQCLNGNADPPTCTTPPNRAPSPPVHNVPNTVEADTAFDVRFTATDPDGDALRYGFDATADGTVDAWYPASGYVASGSTETRSWRLSPGTFTFQVLAQDSKGLNSAWVRHTITVTAPACPALSPQETRVLETNQLVSRVLRGENVKVYATAVGTSVLVSRGAQAEVVSPNAGLALYFEGPASEYAMSSGGNNLVFVDRCGRTTRVPVQGPLTVNFYFADGSFAADIDSAQHQWRLLLRAGNLYFDALTENLADVQSTVKANLRASSSQGRF